MQTNTTKPVLKKFLIKFTEEDEMIDWVVAAKSAEDAQERFWNKIISSDECKYYQCVLLHYIEEIER